LKTLLSLIFLSLFLVSSASAQSPPELSAAKETIQPAQTFAAASLPGAAQLTLPAGTIIDVEVAHTVNSLEVKRGEKISFRVLVPIVVNGMTVIDKDALVTARVTDAKRGGHWGKAGKLSWSMEDVIAVDNSRVLLAPQSGWRSDKLWSLDNKNASNETRMGDAHIRGTSHSGEVAAMSVASGVLFPPLALMGGFKRGENAVLREGRRFVVAVAKDTVVKSAVPAAAP